MTTALAWGFVASVLMWKLNLIPDLWLSAFFLATWAAAALVQYGHRQARLAKLWGLEADE